MTETEVTSTPACDHEGCAADAIHTINSLDGRTYNSCTRHRSEFQKRRRPGKSRPANEPIEVQAVLPGTETTPPCYEEGCAAEAIHTIKSGNGSTYTVCAEHRTAFEKRHADRIIHHTGWTIDGQAVLPGTETPRPPRQPHKWEQHYPIHPAALLARPQTTDEHAAIVADLRKRGKIMVPIVLWKEAGPDGYPLRPGDVPSVLDGVHRLDTFEDEFGELEIDPPGAPQNFFRNVPFKIEVSTDPYGTMIAFNVVRRQMSPMERADLAIAVAKAREAAIEAGTLKSKPKKGPKLSSTVKGEFSAILRKSPPHRKTGKPMGRPKGLHATAVAEAKKMGGVSVRTVESKLNTDGLTQTQEAPPQPQRPHRVPCPACFGRRTVTPDIAQAWERFCDEVLGFNRPPVTVVS